MARYRPEPRPPEGSPARVGVLLINLGTPAAPTAAAVRPYLRQFLSDPRVVEIPRLVWWPILNGIILNIRPAKSAAKYASVWMDEGSPLAVHTARQARMLAGYLGQRSAAARELVVDWAMRYGQPAVDDALDRMRAAGCDRILIVPMYPQYAASTTASAMDAVSRWLLGARNQPEIRTIRDFHQDPAYIRALATSVREHWMRNGQGEVLVMSFHGLPRRSRDLGDPYHDECQRTGQLLAEALQLDPQRAVVTFQSRFGRAEWLQPYTEPTLEKLARDGVSRVDVICPGFTSDCLETLEEIAMECRAAFIGAGGQQFHYIPCLNERHEWIEALADLVLRHLGHWLPETSASGPDDARLALRLGARP